MAGKRRAGVVQTAALIVFVLALVGMILCPVHYSIIGSYVAADGTLVEPFFLVPLAYGFLLLAVVSAVVYLCARRRQRKRLSRG